MGTSAVALTDGQGGPPGAELGRKDQGASLKVDDQERTQWARSCLQVA